MDIVLLLLLTGMLVLTIYCGNKLLKRSDKVLAFRLWVLDNDFTAYKQLPGYIEMLFDGKDLKLDSHFIIETSDHGN